VSDDADGAGDAGSSDDEADWFERALRETDADAEPEAESTDEEEPPFLPTDADEATSSESASEPDAADATSPGTGDAPETSEDDFDQDFSTAFERAPSPGDSGEVRDPFGADEEFDFEDFGASGDTEGFDEEEFESDLDRIDVGIEGLDEMILGGVPEQSLVAAIGSAGTGKTTFGLQFVHQALENDERAVFIALEESRTRVLATADEKGWDFSGYAESDQLAVLDLDPIEMANSLSSIRNDLPRLINEFDAERLVLDSVSLLEMMYDSPSRRRSEVFEFSRSLKQAGVTTMVTSEASEDSPYNSRYGIIEYLADAVFVLQYVRPSDFRETRLAIEIQKIRDANHSRETKPYELTDEGISVYRQANIF
jgi:KaiC domain protein